MSRRLIVLLAVILGLLALAPVVGASEHNDTFTASLKGSNEVPPNDSAASGEAVIKLRDGDLSFKLIVANIDDVVAAHIHCAPAGVNGPVGVTLFSGGPTSDSGILSQGAITSPDPGNACGWVTLDDVIAALQGGDTYVNVHTVTLPGGEIRGQVS